MNVSLSTEVVETGDPLLTTLRFRCGEDGQRAALGILRGGPVDVALLEAILIAGAAAIEFWDEVGALVANDAQAAHVDRLLDYLADQGHTVDHPAYRARPVATRGPAS